jgi:hypothetical protein
MADNATSDGALGAEGVHHIERPDADRAAVIGRLYARADSRWLAELLIDLEDDVGEFARLVLVDGLRARLSPADHGGAREDRYSSNDLSTLLIRIRESRIGVGFRSGTSAARPCRASSPSLNPRSSVFPARPQRLNVGTPEPQKHAAAHARNRPDRVRRAP